MSGLRVAAVVPERGLDVSLIVEPGETVAVAGPNGAGKSSLLGVIAGIVVAPQSTVTWGETDLHRLPTHRRRVGLLEQDPLLFPHLDVLANVTFGPRSAGVGRAPAQAVARDWLARVGASELAERPVDELSGGQAQRVAIARTLAADPEIVLLDEPFGALDVDAVDSLRDTLVDVLAGRTTILVTHQVLDARLLAHRVVVLEGGRVVEQGATYDRFHG